MGAGGVGWRCEMAATGSRPSECWWPCERTNKVEAPAEPPTDCERTNEVALESSTGCEQTSKAQGETLSSFAPNAEVEAPSPGNDLRSFARTPMTLAELCNAVNAIGGRLMREGDGCMVQAPAGTLTPEMEAALTAHQEELLALLPPPRPHRSRRRRTPQSH